MKAIEEQVLTAKEAPAILMVEVNMRILTVGVLQTLTVEEPVILMAEEEEEVEMLMVAAAEVAMVTVTVQPVTMTKLIRAIIMWYLCQERLVTAPDQNAAYRNVSPKKDHGLVSEDRLTRRERDIRDKRY